MGTVSAHVLEALLDDFDFLLSCCCSTWPKLNFSYSWHAAHLGLDPAFHSAYLVPIAVNCRI